MLDFVDVEYGFILLVLVGIIDFLCEEVVVVVVECQVVGIVVKMIIGDYVDIVWVIGVMFGIGIDWLVLIGVEIELFDDQCLCEVLLGVDVFVCVSFEYKLCLVQVLQVSGEVVVMIGDGVNDVLVLKCVDVGVVMGNKGIEVVKEVVEVVFVDDNFVIIVNVVCEGRVVYDNLKKFIFFMLLINGGEVLIVIVVILFQLILLMMLVQIFWINMVIFSILGLVLVFDLVECGLMQCLLCLLVEFLLLLFFVWWVLLVLLLMMVGVLGLFFWELEYGIGLESVWIMVVNSVVVCEMFYLFNSWYIYDLVFSCEGLFGNCQVLLVIVVCVVL